MTMTPRNAIVFLTVSMRNFFRIVAPAVLLGAALLLGERAAVYVDAGPEMGMSDVIDAGADHVVPALPPALPQLPGLQLAERLTLEVRFALIPHAPAPTPRSQSPPVAA